MMDLYLAVARDDLATVQEIVRTDLIAGRDRVSTPTRYSNSPLLMVAAQIGSVRMVSFLLDHGAHVCAADRHSRSALHWASWEGHYAVVEALLRAGASPDAEDAEGSTALIDAAGGGFVNICRMLLACPDIRVDARMHNGQTALRKAAVYGRTKVVRLLLQHRADPTLIDDEGRTAAEGAAAAGQHAAWNLLKEWDRVYMLYKLRMLYVTVRAMHVRAGLESSPCGAHIAATRAATAPAFIKQRVVAREPLPRVHMAAHACMCSECARVGVGKAQEVGRKRLVYETTYEQEQLVAVTRFVVTEMNCDLFLELRELVGVTSDV